VSDFLELDRQNVWHPYTQSATAPTPLGIVRASGSWLYDSDGGAYLDLLASWWTNVHGHAHPAITRAIAEQAATLDHVIFADVTHPPAATLAARLAAHLAPPLSRVFFSDNGSTAVEVALKMAFQYAINCGRPRSRILALEGAYHGDTFGAMSAGHSSGFFTTFAPWLFSVDTIPYPATWIGDNPTEKEAASLTALDAYLARHGGECAALIVEPLLQGASGMRTARASFIAEVCERVRRDDILIIFDEVLTGFGRTGTLFAHERVGTSPDLLCLSKGLTAGVLPMGVTVATERIFSAFRGQDISRALLHGHSFTANPICCAAALASLRLFEEEQTLDRIAKLSAIHTEELAILAQHPHVAQPRALGSIAAFKLLCGRGEYGAPIGRRLRDAMLARGFLIRPLGDVVYFLPPACITSEELRSAYRALSVCIDEIRG
jgi:adenosylmethionine-8-amino-7-oxononanoate aminotransferase